MHAKRRLQVAVAICKMQVLNCECYKDIFRCLLVQPGLYKTVYAIKQAAYPYISSQKLYFAHQ